MDITMLTNEEKIKFLSDRLLGLNFHINGLQTSVGLPVPEGKEPTETVLERFIAEKTVVEKMLEDLGATPTP